MADAKKAKLLPKVCVLCGVAYNDPIETSVGTDIVGLLDGKIRACSLAEAEACASGDDPALGLLTASHPHVDAALLDRISPPGGKALKIISNYGVGVDHIDLAAAKQRGIPVGHTPNVSVMVILRVMSEGTYAYIHMENV